MSRPGLIARLFQSTGEYTKSIVTIAVLSLSMVMIAVAGWNRWGDEITDEDGYRVTAERVSINAPPAWIQSNIKQSVFRDAGLQDLSILDKQAISKLKQAFELNPWVESVEAAQKNLPTAINLEIRYRRPVAMVEVDSGLLPIDRNGVILDPRDFSESLALKFLRIVVDYRSPSGVLGQPWGDPRVELAANIAALLDEDDWKTMGLYRIVALLPNNEDAKFEIRTDNNIVIHWGKGPGREAAGEPGAAEKIERLKALAKVHGSFDRLSKDTVLDLRKLGR